MNQNQAERADTDVTTQVGRLEELVNKLEAITGSGSKRESIGAIEPADNLEAAAFDILAHLLDVNGRLEDLLQTVVRVKDTIAVPRQK